MPKTIKEEEKKLMLELIEAGLYPARIAEKLNLSLPTIMYRLKQLEDSGMIKRQEGKPMFFSMLSNDGMLEIPMHGMNISKNKNRFHSSHKIKLSLGYTGVQPRQGAKLKPFGRYKTLIQAIYKINKRITIVAFNKKLNVWVHYPHGQRTEQQLIQARAEGYMALVRFSKQHNIALEGDLSQVIQSHHVVEDKRANELLAPTVKRYESDIAVQIGTKVCMTSHKGKIEHEGIKREDRLVKGADIAKGLEYLTLDFPKEFKTQKLTNDNIALYAEEIKKHRAAIEEMRDAMREFRVLMKGWKR